mmetsp:Transcript_16657/g.54244  ORF Transcript_16657/g.54244 Transcript_16657/m.54244 type:complete len:388 (-) Transcript_16657:377-1540(-)
MGGLLRSSLGVAFFVVVPVVREGAASASGVQLRLRSVRGHGGGDIEHADGERGGDLLHHRDERERDGAGRGHGEVRGGAARARRGLGAHERDAAAEAVAWRLLRPAAQARVHESAARPGERLELRPVLFTGARPRRRRHRPLLGQRRRGAVRRRPLPQAVSKGIRRTRRGDHIGRAARHQQAAATAKARRGEQAEARGPRGHLQRRRLRGGPRSVAPARRHRTPRKGRTRRRGDGPRQYHRRRLAPAVEPGAHDVRVRRGIRLPGRRLQLEPPPDVATKDPAGGEALAPLPLPLHRRRQALARPRPGRPEGTHRRRLRPREDRRHPPVSPQPHLRAQRPPLVGHLLAPTRPALLRRQHLQPLQVARATLQVRQKRPPPSRRGHPTEK